MRQARMLILYYEVKKIKSCHLCLLLLIGAWPYCTYYTQPLSYSSTLRQQNNEGFLVRFLYSIFYVFVYTGVSHYLWNSSVHWSVTLLWTWTIIGPLHAWRDILLYTGTSSPEMSNVLYRKENYHESQIYSRQECHIFSKQPSNLRIVNTIKCGNLKRYGLILMRYTHYSLGVYPTDAVRGSGGILRWAPPASPHPLGGPVWRVKL